MIRNEVAKCRETFVPGESGKLCQTRQAQAILRERDRDLYTVHYEETTSPLLILLGI